MRLITIPFSHYSEKSRWMLDHIGASYAEDARLPMAHLLATIPLGGRTVPLLVDGPRVLADSTDILLYLDRLAPGRLLPLDPAGRAAALDIEEFCDRHIGTASRAWVYSETLVKPWSLGKNLGRTQPPLRRAALPLVMTLAGPVIARSYRVKPGHPDKWIARLNDAFGEISKRLAASGGSFLVGDQLTAADISFAALAAPALMPDEHPVMKPDPATISPGMSEVLRSLRQTPAGQHALRMYREFRR